jgi:tRNA(Ile)-lysidine synthase TilS/MesJ
MKKALVTIYCLDYDSPKYLGVQAFEKILDTSKGKGNRYNCLVPISGGRDSAFVLFQMKKKFNLNVLAYNYDNGFVSSTAQQNVKNITENLGIDLVSMKSKRDIHRKNLRHVIKLNLHKSPEHLIPAFCEGCGFGIWGGAYKVAKEKGILLVIFGESKMESGTAKKILGERLRPGKKEKLKYVLKMPANFVFRKYYSILFEKEFPPNDFRDIQKINYYDYIKWDENEILSVIRNEMGWRQEEGMSSWRFDCKIHAVVSYLHKKLFGFTEQDELYSKMIRDNQITRDEALARLALNAKNDEKELEIVSQVFEILNLDQHEQEAILNCETLS